ncbi:YbaB/EbfC family nucleoid-associated protein [Nocardia salmonicida]|uniref:YbaB/EbfC family nucleoid-associated protein n=1 Tax=Nocardia salmonicida TaxID=53431 RepID=UPI0036700BAE
MTTGNERGAAGDRLRDEATQVLDEVVELISGIAAAQIHQRQLTATVSVEGERITVVADASGAVDRIEFADDIDELSYGQLARSTLRAAQQAAEQVRDRADELLAPLRSLHARLPKLSDLVDWLPPQDELPPPPRALLTPPDERDPRPDPVPGHDDPETLELIELQQQRALLYAVGAAAGGRVTVAVNADGVMIDLRLSGNVGDLDYDELAEVIVECSRVAVAAVARKVAALYGTGRDDRPHYEGPTAMVAELNLFRDQLR